MQKTIEMNVVRLAVRQGYLIEVPVHEQGPLVIPFAEGTSWACTISGDSKAFDREFWPRGPRGGQHLYRVPSYLAPGAVVEFGCNLKRQEESLSADVTQSAELIFHAATVRDSGKRRWYGVVRDLDLRHLLDLSGVPEGDGTLELVEAQDAKQALEMAPHLTSRKAPYGQLAAFVVDIRAGDYLALLQFSDWLTDHDDSRGNILRGEVIALVDRLFPEVKRPKAKKTKQQAPPAVGGNQPW